jgi:hypothetical protein
MDALIQRWPESSSQMSPQFIRTKPLQACKLITIIGTFLYAAGAITGLLPGGLDILLFLIVFGLGFTLLIIGETVVTCFRAIRATDSVTDQFANHQLYTAVRAGEAIISIFAAGAFVVIFAVATSGPIAGPGAIGLALIGAGLGALILGSGLTRTLTEYYYHRRSQTV